jgi:hypothetical protein
MQFFKNQIIIQSLRKIPLLHNDQYRKANSFHCLPEQMLASTVYLAWERLSENKPDRFSAAWIKKIVVEDSRPWIVPLDTNHGDRKQVSGHDQEYQKSLADHIRSNRKCITNISNMVLKTLWMHLSEKICSLSSDWHISASRPAYSRI